MIVRVSPPSAGTATNSKYSLLATVRPRLVAPAPRVATISPPSGLHTVFMYSPSRVVSCRGVPPVAATRQMWPRPFGSQPVNAMSRPSGDQAGAISEWSKESSVRRVGVPSGSSIVQMRPTAWKARRLPSGDEAVQRGNFTVKVVPSGSWGRPAISEMTRCTRAVNTMVDTSPLSTSTRRIFPPAGITIERLSRDHA